ncbi:MAG: transposase [Verrucomicrobiales bacterium]
MPGAVIDALRAFVPRFLEGNPPLCEAQARALWAITHCRTPAMGGHLYACGACGRHVFAYHSCNHRACPQCGRAATAKWVERELGKRVDVPYFMVTFTLPAELRELFFGPAAKAAYDLFFRAASGTLAEKLAAPKWLGAQVSGFSAILHTWNQRLHFHPHIHIIVPGAGIDRQGRIVRVKNANFLLPVPVLRKAFRWHFRQGLDILGRQIDPSVWTKDWGVHIQPVGNGAAALKYLGAYVCRTAIADSRILRIDDCGVTFRWKDRANGGVQRTERLCGIEFVRRYLRHVLPRGLRSIRYYGFCHPAAKKNRTRIAFHTGRALLIGALEDAPLPASAPLGVPTCPCCHKPMQAVASFAGTAARAPPTMNATSP